jgi:hypothetical protein
LAFTMTPSGVVAAILSMFPGSQADNPSSVLKVAS